MSCYELSRLLFDIKMNESFFDKAAADLAWKRTIRFFQTYLA